MSDFTNPVNGIHGFLLPLLRSLNMPSESLCDRLNTPVTLATVG
ncbi:hypothetical protein [Nostoc sp. FACHB-892]|nr:hypothetical protein [Nostoc sp. FACHB-892]